MESIKQLRRQYVSFVKSTYREELQSADQNPQFISSVVNQFVVHSDRLLPKLDLALSLIEQKLIDPEVKDNVHRIKGSSMSVGAKKVTDLCIAFQDFYDTVNYEKCLEFLLQIKEQYHLAKDKLQTVPGLQQQILAAGGSIPNLK